MKKHIAMNKASLMSLLAIAANISPPAMGQEAAFVPATGQNTHQVSDEEKSTSKVTITIEDDGRTTTRTFEIPSSTLKIAEPVLEWAGFELGKSQSNRGVYLGVMLDEPGNTTDGVKLNGVLENSPAARAGLQKGDVLKKLDDQLLINPPQLTALIGARKEGDKVSLTYERGGETQTVEVALAAREQTNDMATLKFLATALSKVSGHDLEAPNIDLSEIGKTLRLNIPPAVEFLRGNVIRFGEKGEVIVEELKTAAEAASKSAAKAVSDVAEKQKDVEIKRNQNMEELRARMVELRDNWAKAQEKHAQEQAEVMKQLREELQKANEAARQAQKEARQALEKIKQQASPSAE